MTGGLAVPPRDSRGSPGHGSVGLGNGGDAQVPEGPTGDDPRAHDPWPGGADLHTHTTASDGTVTPAERVWMAREARLAAVAVTDHDTLAGLAEARAAAAQAGIQLIAGVELGCELQLAGRRVDVHVLGYWVDEGDAPLEELLQKRRRARQERLVRMLERLAAAGVRVEEERVRAVAGDAPVGRPHVARVLVEMGLANTVAEAFERFLVPGRPGYVPRRPLPPEQAIAAIRRAGGVPVLAHPGLMPAQALQRLPQWKSQGLAGLEVYHTKHTPAQAQWFLRLAAQHDLAPSGGSDCHGPQPGSPPLMGRVRVPMAWVERLRQRASRP